MAVRRTCATSIGGDVENTYEKYNQSLLPHEMILILS